MDSAEIIRNFRKEKGYRLGFMEGVAYAVWVFTNCAKNTIRENKPLEKGAIVGESGPELLAPGCNKIPDIYKDFFKDQPPIELNIDLKKISENSDFIKQLRERLKNEKS